MDGVASAAVRGAWKSTTSLREVSWGMMRKRTSPFSASRTCTQNELRRPDICQCGAVRKEFCTSIMLYLIRMKGLMMYIPDVTRGAVANLNPLTRKSRSLADTDNRSVQVDSLHRISKPTLETIRPMYNPARFSNIDQQTEDHFGLRMARHFKLPRDLGAWRYNQSFC